MIRLPLLVAIDRSVGARTSRATCMGAICTGWHSNPRQTAERRAAIAVASSAVENGPRRSSLLPPIVISIKKRLSASIGWMVVLIGFSRGWIVWRIERVRLPGERFPAGPGRPGNALRALA